MTKKTKTNWSVIDSSMPLRHTILQPPAGRLSCLNVTSSFWMISTCDGLGLSRAVRKLSCTTLQRHPDVPFFSVYSQRNEFLFFSLSLSNNIYLCGWLFFFSFFFLFFSFSSFSFLWFSHRLSLSFLFCSNSGVSVARCFLPGSCVCYVLVQ